MIRPPLLADENFPAPAVRKLREAGLDVLSIGETTPGLDDVQVLRIACEQHRWLLTFDRDFGELVFARHLPAPPAIVLTRAGGYNFAEEPAFLIWSLLESAEAAQGGFFVIDERGTRCRPFKILIECADDVSQGSDGSQGTE